MCLGAPRLTPYRAPKEKESLILMASEQIQTPVDKVSLEFVDRATQIVTLFSAHLDAKCPHCLQLLKSGIGNQPIPADGTEQPIPAPTRNDQR
jgi:hypothetical protein